MICSEPGASGSSLSTTSSSPPQASYRAISGLSGSPLLHFRPTIMSYGEVVRGSRSFWYNTENCVRIHRFGSRTIVGILTIRPGHDVLPRGIAPSRVPPHHELCQTMKKQHEAAREGYRLPVRVLCTRTSHGMIPSSAEARQMKRLARDCANIATPRAEQRLVSVRPSVNSFAQAAPWPVRALRRPGCPTLCSGRARGPAQPSSAGRDGIEARPFARVRWAHTAPPPQARDFRCLLQRVQ